MGDKHDVVYRAKKELKIPTNVEPNEEAVYRLIAESATMGIWRRDIDHQIPIEKKDLTKLLNSLIKRSIIKKVGTSVKNRYMLAELQPDRSITGGAFYEGERFDKELVEVGQKKTSATLVAAVRSAIASNSYSGNPRNIKAAHARIDGQKNSRRNPNVGNFPLGLGDAVVGG